MFFSDPDMETLKSLSNRYGLEAAALGAVMTVESVGVAFIPKTRLPIIRWEGHYFYHFLNGSQRDRAVREGLASPKLGGVRNPTSYAERYSLLRKAIEINAVAAYGSVSIGVGQIMGANYAILGYDTPRSMFADACTGFEAQVKQLILFIDHKGLRSEIQRHDWTAFARGYNGPDYIRNKYHIKLAEAYSKLESDARFGDLTLLRPRLTTAETMLRLGSNGARVREIQKLLKRAGAGLTIDGDFGPSTKQAVVKFQHNNLLEADGVVGPKTAIALSCYHLPMEPLAGKPTVLDVPERAAGGVSSIGGLGAVATADKLEDFAGKLTESSTGLGWLVNGLYIGGAALIVLGIFLSFYGWMKVRRTFQGTIR